MAATDAEPASPRGGEQGEVTEERPRLSEFLAWEEFSLKALAGATALLLGILYAYGALIKAGQLHAAGQNVGDTLPLIPLEQVLVLGINQVLPLGAALFVVALLIMALIERANATRHKQPVKKAKQPSRGSDSKLAKRFLLSAGALLIVWAILRAPWVSVFLFGEILVGSWYASFQHTTPRGNAVFALLAIGLYFAALAYFAPDPLPQVRLETDGGRLVRGELIATNGSSWFIGTSGGGWTAVQGEAIQEVEVTPVDKETPESLLHAITGSDLPSASD